ncbi:MAG: alkaline phosphatase [Saprospirales bacterium]|nr:alkaline phosphatase [Saprospirales bacterium]
MDRDTTKEPSLAEMTQKAIDILSQDPDGFFLMVEGSQVDWAAHNNEPIGLITDFLAFDKAVDVGLKFAQTNGSTMVVVCPDHGNGGISIGNEFSNTKSTNIIPNFQYDSINVSRDIINPLTGAKYTGRRTAESLIGENSDSYARVVQENYGLTLTKMDIRRIHYLMHSKLKDTIGMIEHFLGSKLSEENFIGWTTTGHTGEDVFLGIYHPDITRRMTGVVDNTDIAKYICDQLKLGDLSADSLYFNKVGLQGYEDYEGIEDPINKTLVFRLKKGKERTTNTITLVPNVNYYLLNGEKIDTRKR